MSIQENNITLDEVTEESVVDFLRANPKFFAKHSSLLATLNIPHPVGDAVSLIEYQVKILRNKNEKLNSKLKEMITAARNNDKINDRMFHLCGALIRVTSLDDTLMVIEESMYDDFEADAVSIRFFDPNNKAPINYSDSIITKNDPRIVAFDNLFKVKRPLCGHLKSSQLDFLFGKQAQNVHSTALVPIGRRCDHGFIAIGSRDRKRFSTNKDTSFLTNLSELLGSALQGKL